MTSKGLPDYLALARRLESTTSITPTVAYHEVCTEAAAAIRSLVQREQTARELLTATSERLATLNDKTKARAHDAVVAELMLSSVRIDAFLKEVK